MDERMTLETVVRFLLGEGELDGVWFGDKPSGERGNYWWRKHLREATAHLAQPAQAVDVGMVREVIAELAKRANTGFNTNDRARCGHWETQLTRAIGNAQADGWRVPEGWALVPVTPTMEMLSDAGTVNNYDVDAGGKSDADHVAWWQSMIASAPTPPQPEE